MHTGSATPRRGRKRKYTLAGLALAVAAGFASSYALYNSTVIASVPAPQAVTAAPIGNMPGSFASLIAKVKPAVVNISTTAKISRGEAMQNMPNPFPQGTPFDQFFRHFFEQQGQLAPQEIHALGSGFIIDPSGYIVTNNHVIDNAEKITVILDDGTRYPAKVKGRDTETDLALLKIEPKHPLPYVSWGDSTTAQVGDWVVAIGDPFGLGGTATAGIISARGRHIQSGPFDDFIQVDAPINRGNSGGPLFNTEGQVIGINTAIYSPNGGSVGIGFAIPSSMAKTVIAQLQQTGKVARGWLGVTVQTVTQDVADNLGLKEAKGALVASVLPDSPAAKAGIETGDVITAFNGHEVKQMSDLPLLVANTKPEEKANVKVWRNGREHTLKAVIALRPSEKELAQAGQSGQAAAQPKGKLGLALAPLTAQARQQYQLPDNTKGVLIVGVQDNSQAAEKGLQPGDVIVMVGRQAVSNPDQVVHAVKQAELAKRDSVLMLVKRGNQQEFVTLNIG
jgi:serine protease Do